MTCSRAAFSVGAVDAGIVSILSPGTFVDTGATVIPSARIRNNSSYPMTFDAWFILTDETDAEIYRYSTAVAALAGGETRDVTWTENWPAPHAEGPYAARCSLAVSDENAGNNELGRDFTVGSRPPWGPGWEEVMPMPLLPSSKAVKRGGWLAMGPEGLIYATKGYKTGDFYRYDAVRRHAGPSWPTSRPGPRARCPRRAAAAPSDGVEQRLHDQGQQHLRVLGLRRRGQHLGAARRRSGRADAARRSRAERTWCTSPMGDTRLRLHAEGLQDGVLALQPGDRRVGSPGRTPRSA